MATGTAPVTGTRFGGVTGSRMAPPPKQSPFAKIIQQFTALPPRARLIIAITAVLLFIGVIAGMAVKSAGTPKYVFEGRKLTQEDVGDITKVLDDLKIKDYVVEDNGEAGQRILVSPEKKYYVQIELSKRGLPRRSVGGGPLPSNAPTSIMNEYYKKELRGDIIMTLRQIDGIVDATINLVVPEKSTFLDEKEESKAAVMLRLRQGYELQGETIMAITNLVANSVEGLKSENVQIADTNGRRYYTGADGTAKGPSRPVGKNGMPQTELERQAEYERYLKEQAQSMLDEALGQGRSVVRVAAALDFSQTSIESKKYGGPVNIVGKVVTGRQSKKERYNGGGSKSANGFHQVSQSSRKGSKNNLYEKVEETENSKVDERITKKIVQQGKVEHLTVSVLVDNLHPDMMAKIQSVVKNAVGFEPNRGDSISVVSLPFSKNEMDSLRDKLLSTPIEGNRLPFGNISPQAMTKMLAVPIVLALIVMGLFVLRAQKVEAEKSKLILATVPTGTVNDISDLLNDKSGRSVAPETNKHNSVEQLEKLAKEKPSKVADLLKTTFLVDR